MAIATQLRQWQAVQFHVRDADASATDLGLQLDRYRDRASGAAAGALLFSCLGRGEYLYGRAGHDSDVFRSKVGNVTLGGFFCNGEIGPVAERTYLHGYTSAFAVFHRKHPSH